jgi:hypothetical protein
VENYVRIYRVVPKPDVDREEFEAFFVKNVLPAVETGQTRGGQIYRSSLLRDERSEREDRYLWLIYSFGTDASWVEFRLEDAMERVRSVGMLLSSTVLTELGAVAKPQA